MTNGNLFRKLYLAVLSAIAFFLPLSVWLLSFFTILLAIVWFAGGSFSNIKLLLKKKKTVLIFLGFYIVYVIWMAGTNDFSSGLWELKKKIPILVFPLAVGLSDPLSVKEIKNLLSFFISGVVLSSIIGVAAKIVPVLSGLTDPREISLFDSHIRLALMAVFSIYCCGWLYLNSERENKRNLIYPAVAVWLTAFLFLLLSVTGLIVFSAVMILTSLIVVVKSDKPFYKYSISALLLLFLGTATFFILREIKSFYRESASYPVPLEKATLNGRDYLHYSGRKDIENGNRVWIYINEDELRKEWNRKSQIPYDSTDRKGQVLRFTLMRYLTSEGLRKDSLGISKLERKDIANIENGMTNHLFSEGKPVRAKIYQVIWQIDYYFKGGNPSGNSVTQRFEYLKTGWHIFQRAPFFGSGTGDLVKEFERQYNLDKTILTPEYRAQTHNQYLTFLISFGIVGFVIICFTTLFPFIKNNGFRSYLPTIFVVITFLSMLGEDPLETHTGVSFFAYFYSVFIFGKSDEEDT
jgi:hypothetical protein